MKIGRESKLIVRESKRQRWIGFLICGLVLVCVLMWGLRWQRFQADREEGLRLAKAGNQSDAEPLLLKTWDRNPDDVDVVAALAQGKLRSSDPESAEPFLTRWCELQPGNVRPIQLRMDLRHRIARGKWSAADRLRIMDEAIADGQRVLDLAPTNDVVRREFLWLLIQVGRFGEAEVECRTCIQIAPQDGWLHFLLAKACQGQSKRAEAEAALDPVVRAQPKFADALLLRAKLHREAEQPDKAIPLLRQALALDTCPRRECLYQLGLALGAAGQAEEAGRVMAEVNLLSLKGAMTNDSFPETDSMRVQVAEAMLGMGKLNEAKDQLDRVLGETPDFAPAHRVLALYFDLTNQPDKATEHRRLASRKDAR